MTSLLGSPLPDDSNFEALPGAPAPRWPARDAGPLDLSQDLTLLYQPVVCTRTGVVVGAEALVRWAHDVTPPPRAGQIVAHAEASGQARALDSWALQRACADALTWADAPGAPWVAVNISAETLCDPTFFSEVLCALDAAALPPQRLVLEITERAAIPSWETAQATAAALEQAGVRLALDDFGTDHSNLDRLRDLPVQVVKLDATFTSSLAAGGRGQVMVQHLLQLAHVLGVTVVAEGVESATQRLVLEALGCDLSQGWFFFAAMPADELASTAARGPARRDERLVSLDAVRDAARLLRQQRPGSTGL